MRNLISMFNRIAKQPHRPNEANIRKLYTMLGIPIPPGLFLALRPPPHPKEQLAAGIHRASDALTSALPGRQPQSKDELGGGDGDAAAEVGKGHLERVSLGD